MPGIDFKAVRDEISIAQVLDLVGFVPSGKRGHELRGPCPIHGSTSKGSRTFSADLEENCFQCFKCGAKGNQLDLWAQFTKQSILEAARDLCQQVGVPVPWKPRQRRPRKKRSPEADAPRLWTDDEQGGGN